MKVSRRTTKTGSTITESADHFVLDTMSDSPNVSLELYVDEVPTEFEFSDLARDVFEFAAAVYLADECSPRVAAIDHWSRDFDYDFAVHSPSVWEAASDSLASCLSFLSGDRYKFTWPRRKALPRLVRHRKRLSRSTVQRQLFDRVSLFSGGVDSLLGATAYLEQGERLLLLGHYADTATSAAQRELARAIQRKYPGRANFVQCRIQRHRGAHRSIDLPPKNEKTHRTRSFLFLSVAAAIAHSYSIGKISIPENGLIALNPPLEMSRSGSLSTRTAHPLFLTKFVQAMSDLKSFSGSLENPYLFLSKTDIVHDPADWLRPLLQRSVSCARPNRYQDRRVRHCGYCVPCLYRRGAFLPAGLDRGTREYAFDVLRNLSVLPNALQADFRALVRFAHVVSSATSAELTRLVLSHGYFPPEIASRLGQTATSFSPWVDMLRRWSTGFIETVATGSSTKTADLIGLRRRRK